ncbi:MAG TPA: squalene synthase HpnC [Sphingomonas sp.]|nr:squalene synthase HpnC [Sphingomonas sp.]
MTEAAKLASGKGHRDENFPVASRLIAARHRPAILAFYAFARAADDIADHPTAAPADKLAGLEAMRATRTGESDAEPTALALRGALAARGLDATHPLDLLEAFRRDVTKRRYASWDELMDYCRYSAAPVGRFVLDVHGEDAARAWPLSDPLCAALQVINHLQDCGKDYRNLDRVYLPEDMLAAAGARVEDLAAPRAAPALRQVIAALAERCEGLLEESAPFARAIRDRRLGLEVAVIQRLALDLARRLRLRDPLSERVHHGKGEALWLAVPAAIARMVRA